MKWSWWRSSKDGNKIFKGSKQAQRTLNSSIDKHDGNIHQRNDGRR